jgi:antitoxin MazE
MTRIRIAKWGNSSAIRLPKTMLNKLGLKQGDTVELTIKDGKGLLEPVGQPERPKKITLEWIISEMKRLGPENAPETVDGGPDWGSEIIDDEYSRGEITLDDILEGRLKDR